MGRLHDVKFSKTTKVHIGDIVIEEMLQQILVDQSILTCSTTANGIRWWVAELLISSHLKHITAARCNSKWYHVKKNNMDSQSQRH